MKHIIETEHWSGLCSKKKIASGKGLHLTLVVNGVFNAFFSFTSIVLNILTIQALRTTTSLAKILLLSLVVSDLGVGLLVQPLYTVRCNSCDEHTTKHWKHCLCYSIQSVFDPEKNISVLASHFGVISLTVYRILAIHLHLRYQELVTHKRVVVSCVRLWILLLYHQSL